MIHFLDARRLLCPLPVIRVQDSVATLAPGEQLQVTCTDPGVLHDIPAWCRINGHKILDTRRTDGEIVLLLEVGAGDA
jgi:tRNA 2-thiouridine synthesizing protein A